MFYVCYVYCDIFTCGMYVLSHACEIQDACCLWVGVQESSKVGEENAGLRQQLGDIQASLHQLTNTNQATLQDAQVPLPLPTCTPVLRPYLVFTILGMITQVL